MEYIIVYLFYSTLFLLSFYCVCLYITCYLRRKPTNYATRKFQKICKRTECSFEKIPERVLNVNYGCSKVYAAATAAKSLQLCPTLCNPIDGSPTRLPHPWDSPGKNTGVGCRVLLQKYMLGLCKYEIIHIDKGNG